MAMDKEIKEKWLAALRSGDYKQGQYALKRVDDVGNTSYCCMGVLACIVGKENKMENNDFYNDNVYEELAQITRGPGDWSSIKSHEYTHKDGSIKHLATHNDSGDTFLEIADIIEEYF
jgi:hypothetical protein